MPAFLTGTTHTTSYENIHGAEARGRVAQQQAGSDQPVLLPPGDKMMSPYGTTRTLCRVTGTRKAFRRVPG
jgi:hypothetical protein